VVINSLCSLSQCHRPLLSGCSDRLPSRSSSLGRRGRIAQFDCVDGSSKGSAGVISGYSSGVLVRLFYWVASKLKMDPCNVAQVAVDHPSSEQPFEETQRAPTGVLILDLGK